jgi:hypothetical protein
MVMPNFIIIGAAKAGTTSLYEYLKQHPQIWMSPVKETNFFALEGETLDFRGPGDQDYINSFSITKIEDYLNLFQGVSNQVAIGEASPLYLYSPKAPERIRHYIPNTKLVAILRNPVERAYSQFLMFVRDGREPLRDFAEALRQEETRMRNHWEWTWQYTRVGFYYVQLQRYFDTFDRSQISVYLFDDFNTNPVSVLQDIFQFLGVNDSFIPDMSVKHNVSVIPKHQNSAELLLRPQVRRQVVEVYREDISKLQELLQRDLSKWLE